VNIQSVTKGTLTNLSAAAVLAGINVIYAVSFASLLFSGDLTPFIPIGVGILLFSNAISAIILSLTSSIPGLISTFKTNIVAIMGVMAASVGAVTLTDRALPTIVTAISVSTMATGVFLFFLGSLHLGNLIRFIPYPVVGGFFAGTGFLIVKGAVPVIMEIPLTLANLPLWLELRNVIIWGPSLLFALLLLKLEEYRKNSLTMPVALVAAMGLFYGVLLVTGTSLAQAKAMGLLFQGFHFHNLLPAMGLSLWQHMDLSVLAGQYESILAIVLISPMLCLILISGIEVGTGKDVTLEKDLKGAGAANMVIGLLGGVASFHTAADTGLSHRLGARSRVVGILFGLICAACLFMGPALISFFPKFVMGGLLLYQGISFIIDWVYRARTRMPRLDHILVWIILFSVVVLGFVKGVMAGILIAFIFFVFNYSRTSVFRHILSAKEIRSRVDRSVLEQDLLRKKGDQIRILPLQGYIFFGSAHRILGRIKGWPEMKKDEGVNFIILDFRWVTNIDMSAISILLKLRQFTDTRKTQLLLTDLNRDVAAKLNLVDFFAKEDGKTLCRPFSDLDHALEWCEDRMLSLETIQKEKGSSLEEHLKGWFSRPEMSLRFIPYLETLRADVGKTLFRQGDPSDCLYILISGKITIHLEKKGRKRIRLLTMRSGSIMGEMGLYTSSARTATAETETPCRLATLSVEAFHRMQKDDPDVAAEVHKFIVTLLSERIGRADQALNMLIP